MHLGKISTFLFAKKLVISIYHADLSDSTMDEKQHVAGHEGDEGHDQNWLAQIDVFCLRRFKFQFGHSTQF